MEPKLKITVPKELERSFFTWLHRHQPWEREPDRPQRLEDATPLYLRGTGGPPSLWLPSGHIILPPIQGGARTFTAASSMSLDVDSAPVTAAPFSVALWASGTTDGATAFYLGDKDSADDNMWILGVASTAGGDPIAFGALAAGAGAATTSADVGAGTNHLAAREILSNSRAVYLNGTNEGTNATSKAPAGADRIKIGGRGDSTPSNFWQGDIAEVGIWSVDIGSAAVATLSGSRTSALLVLPASLVFYLPVIGRFSPEIDIVGGLNLTVTNAPTAAAHPRIFPPPVRVTTYIQAAAAAGSAEQLVNGGLVSRSLVNAGRVN